MSSLATNLLSSTPDDEHTGSIQLQDTHRKPVNTPVSAQQRTVDGGPEYRAISNSSHGEPDLNQPASPGSGSRVRLDQPGKFYILEKDNTVHRDPSVSRSLKAWMPEIWCCILAIVLLVVLAITLSLFDGQCLPDWPLGFTVNTAVALLSTVCRTAVVIPIAEGISQLKWNWFVTGQRPVRDIHVFDQASRGPWGSLMLLTKVRGRFTFLSIVASIILVGSLVTPPLTQSTISYSTRLVATLDENVVTKAAIKYPDGIRYNSGQDTQQAIADGMLRAARQAVFHALDEPWPPPEPRCPTAQCRWKLFSSLAVCVSMGNITKSLDHSYFSDEGRLRDWSGSVSKYIDLNVTSPMPEFATFPEPRKSLLQWDNPHLLTATIAQFFFVYKLPSNVPISPSLRPQAIELLLHYCVNTYNISVEKSLSKAELIYSNVGIDSIDKKGEVIPMVDHEGQRGFNVSGTWAYTALETGLQDTFTGVWYSNASTGTIGLSMYQLGMTLFNGVSTYMDGSSPKTMGDAQQIIWNNLKNFSGTIADAMTAYMRTNQATGDVIGESLSLETFITVRWGWLSFLAIQVSLANIFLIAVMVQTRRLDFQVIKSSNIAELFAIRRRLEGEMDAAASATVDCKTELMGIKREVNEHLLGRLSREEGDVWNLEIERRESTRE
ncbi:hypothetical protein PT974_02787 [Cladobotryum mycophilum]|uniref:Uncharacterized protein n=1 Tax=Cladobotryum mycophilum TaxID=491253 RepID=A0ABR0T094_9HYPO